MGDILYKFEGFKPQLHIERRVDRIEKQELNMSFTTGHDSRISTETGNQIIIFCRDEDGNMMEVDLPVSVKELKEALENYDN